MSSLPNCKHSRGSPKSSHSCQVEPWLVVKKAVFSTQKNGPEPAELWIASMRSHPCCCGVQTQRSSNNPGCVCPATEIVQAKTAIAAIRILVKEDIRHHLNGSCNLTLELSGRCRVMHNSR